MNIVRLIFSLLLPLAIGMLSASFSSPGMAAYGGMVKPPLSPPAWAFPIAWTILYLMMGFASYLIMVAEVDTKTQNMALTFYMIQLAMNFMWSLIFFRWNQYLLAFIWLVLLWALVLACAFQFIRISIKAGLLMIPYILWLTFAGYLNLGAYILSAGKR